MNLAQRLVFGTAIIASGLLVILTGSVHAAEPLKLHARFRTPDKTVKDRFVIGEKPLEWQPGETALVICDMWDKHWCPHSTTRVEELAGRMNEVVSAARKQGVLIIHCPSDTMDYYKEHPGRKLAQAAPELKLERPIARWCSLDLKLEGPLPIDDSDGGCDTENAPKSFRAWTKQHDAIEIKDGDAITDNAEAFYLMKHKGIKNVIVMGVHTNMCVLGRPFSIRQMVLQGQNVVLMRDMTDTMYNPKSRPQVTHFTGTDLVVGHIEKYWCPTITSTDFTGQPPLVFKDDTRPHVVSVANDSEYDQHRTIPLLCEELQNAHGFRMTNILPRKGQGFAGLEEALKSASVLIIAPRREALTASQRDAIKQFIEQGKPVIGIRTASHAFGARGQLAPGLVAWDALDRDVFGGDYQGHFENGTEVQAGMLDHPILAGVDAASLKSVGSLYKNPAIDSSCQVLLTGTRVGPKKDAQPIAWVREVGPKKAKVFYTSLGHQNDFDNPHFRKLLINAARWATE